MAEWFLPNSNPACIMSKGPWEGYQPTKSPPKQLLFAFSLFWLAAMWMRRTEFTLLTWGPLSGQRWLEKCYLSAVHFPFMKTALASKQISWVALSVMSRCRLMHWFCFYFSSSLFPVSSSLFHTVQAVAFTIRTHTYCVPRAKLQVDIISSELIVRQHWFSC